MNVKLKLHFFTGKLKLHELNNITHIYSLEKCLLNGYRVMVEERSDFHMRVVSEIGILALPTSINSYPFSLILVLICSQNKNTHHSISLKSENVWGCYNFWFHRREFEQWSEIDHPQHPSSASHFLWFPRHLFFQTSTILPGSKPP